MTRSRGTMLGIVLIVLGGMFLLDSTGVLSLWDFVHDYWPLLLVLWGAAMLMRTTKRQGAGDPGVVPSHHDSGRGAGESSESLHTANIIGDVNAYVTSSVFKGGSVSTVVGDVIVDCREAGLADGEQKLSVSGVIGNARVVIPPGAAVSVSAHTLLGDARVFDQRREGFSASIAYTSAGFADAGKRLHIDVSQVIGDIEIG